MNAIKLRPTKELKDRNKGFVTKFKESTTAITVETTYSVEIGE